MTLRLVDVSRYQVERADPLDLAKAKAAGYSIANVALTGGRGYTAGAWAKTYADTARSLGMGVSTYHWLDGRTPGRDQAMTNLNRLRAMFGAGLKGFAHIVDVEESGANGITPPTFAHVRDYVTTIQQALGRHMVIYTGDWWWTPKGWNGAALTPYVHAAPGTGYQKSYPGDTSPMWAAGYGGWTDLAIMQWGVQPLPGTGNCSLSVLRDHGVWADITGGDQLMPTADPGNAQPDAWLGPPVAGDTLDDLDHLANMLAAQAAEEIDGDDVADLVRFLNGRRFPAPAVDPLAILPRQAGEVCAPVIQAEMSDWVALGGSSSGCVGDAKHGTGFHRGANFVPATDYSRRRDPNGGDGPFTNWNWACAGDFRHGGNAALRARHKAVLALLRKGAFPMICEMIVQPDADKPVMYWARWEGAANLREYTGSGHDMWSHISWYRSRADERPHLWKDVPVAVTDAEIAKIAQATVSKLYADMKTPASGIATQIAASEARVAAKVATLVAAAQAAIVKAVGAADDDATVIAAVRAELAKVTAQIAAGDKGDADRDAAIVSAVLQAVNELRDTVRDTVRDPVGEDELAAAIVRALRDLAKPDGPAPSDPTP
jgi:GH25 family lysozyme M1 (1,4-beta-N-acetylmuramidase)